MKLRIALLLLPILLIAAVAQASPVGVQNTASGSHISSSTRSASIQAISSVRMSHSAAQPQGFVSSVLPSPVPEPATLALFGTGLIGVATMIRRRNGRSHDASDRK